MEKKWAKKMDVYVVFASSFDWRWRGVVCFRDIRSSRRLLLLRCPSPVSVCFSSGALRRSASAPLVVRVHFAFIAKPYGDSNSMATFTTKASNNLFASSHCPHLYAILFFDFVNKKLKICNKFYFYYAAYNEAKTFHLFF